jgi:lipopolysaccharide transport system permease protein
MTAEALSFSVTSVVQNKAALGNSVFPIDLMPPKAVLLAQGTMATGLIVIALTGLLAQTLTWSALFVLIVWPLHVLALIGVGWVLAMLNVVFRDLQNLINALLMILLVASPIAYTPEMVPESLKPLILLNPFAYFVTTYQRVLVLGEPPTPAKTVILLFGSLAVFWFGSWFFGRSKRILVDYV